MFQNNPLTGAFFLAAIAWGAVAAGNVVIAVGAIVALLVATATAQVLPVEETAFRHGLFGFNGVLVGAAVPTFLASGPAMWFVLVVGAAVSTVAMLAVSKIMKVWDTPALTFPFVLTTWFVVLAAYSFGQLPVASMGPPALPHAAALSSDVPTLTAWAAIEAWLKGPAQVFLINNGVSGALVLVGLLLSSPSAALFAALGATVALCVSVVLGANSDSINAGLYGFGAVLTAVALGCVFYKPSLRSAAFALLATIFTVIVQGALDAAVAPVGIPTLTAPFVFVTWLFLLPKLDLEPHLHEPLRNGILSKRRTGHA